MRTLTIRSTTEALRRASRSAIAAAIVDMRFADGRMDGLELALNLRDRDRSLPVWLADSKTARTGPPVVAPLGAPARRGSLSRGKPAADLHAVFKHVRSHLYQGGE